jgi:hypothetical protein
MSKGTFRFGMVMLAVTVSAQVAAVSADLPSHSAAIDAWRSADAATRCALVVPLAAELDPGEAADILLSSPAGSRADWVQRYVLASSILAHTKDNHLWEKKAGADGKDDWRGEWNSFCGEGRKVAVLLSSAPEWQTRLLAADLLGVFGPDGESQCLGSLLDDAMWPVRLRAIEVLGSSTTEESRRLLMLYARSDDRTERLAAIKACNQMRWVPGVLAGLSDSDAEVQMKSISAAGNLLGEESFACGDRERSAVVSALERVSQTAGDQAVRQKALKAVQGFAKRGDIAK